MAEISFPIAERFFTLSGEAPTAGQPMYLIRFSGCNLNCRYCDTPNRNEINEWLTFAQLSEEIAESQRKYPGVFVLFTGGEPLLNERMEAISQLAAEHSETLFYVETNGSVFIRDFGKGNLRYVVDWKTPSSGESDSFCANNIKKLRAGLDCIKIVVDKN
ncbi:MAG: radical SAM protein, partial [Spirochaetales bacterium]|nr:radical SAM protein [Spirochaetales bacterium]